MECTNIPSHRGAAVEAPLSPQPSAQTTTASWSHTSTRYLAAAATAAAAGALVWTISSLSAEAHRPRTASGEVKGGGQSLRAVPPNLHQYEQAGLPCGAHGWSRTFGLLAHPAWSTSARSASNRDSEAEEEDDLLTCRRDSLARVPSCTPTTTVTSVVNGLTATAATPTPSNFSPFVSTTSVPVVTPALKEAQACEQPRTTERWEEEGEERVASPAVLASSWSSHAGSSSSSSVVASSVGAPSPHLSANGSSSRHASHHHHLVYTAASFDGANSDTSDTACVSDGPAPPQKYDEHVDASAGANTRGEQHAQCADRDAATASAHYSATRTPHTEPSQASVWTRLWHTLNVSRYMSMRRSQQAVARKPRAVPPLPSIATAPAYAVVDGNGLDITNALRRDARQDDDTKEEVDLRQSSSITIYAPVSRSQQHSSASQHEPNGVFRTVDSTSLSRSLGTGVLARSGPIATGSLHGTQARRSSLSPDTVHGENVAALNASAPTHALMSSQLLQKHISYLVGSTVPARDTEELVPATDGQHKREVDGGGTHRRATSAHDSARCRQDPLSAVFDDPALRRAPTLNADVPSETISRLGRTDADRFLAGTRSHSVNSDAAEASAAVSSHPMYVQRALVASSCACASSRPDTISARGRTDADVPEHPHHCYPDADNLQCHAGADVVNANGVESGTQVRSSAAPTETSTTAVAAVTHPQTVALPAVGHLSTAEQLAILENRRVRQWHMTREWTRQQAHAQKQERQQQQEQRHPDVLGASMEQASLQQQEPSLSTALSAEAHPHPSSRWSLSAPSAHATTCTTTMQESSSHPRSLHTQGRLLVPQRINHALTSSQSSSGTLLPLAGVKSGSTTPPSLSAASPFVVAGTGLVAATQTPSTAALMNADSQAASSAPPMPDDNHDRRVDDLRVKRHGGAAQYSLSLTYHDAATGSSRTIDARALPPLQPQSAPPPAQLADSVSAVATTSATLSAVASTASHPGHCTAPFVRRHGETHASRDGASPPLGPATLRTPHAHSNHASGVIATTSGLVHSTPVGPLSPSSTDGPAAAITTTATNTNTTASSASSTTAANGGRGPFGAPLPSTEPTHGPRLQGVAGRRGEMVIGAFLGGGACGKVYECLNTETNQLIAAKQLVFDAKDSKLRHRLRQLELELEVLTLSAHHKVEHIVGFHGAEKRGHSVLMYLEYCANGSLLDYMADGKSKDAPVWGGLGTSVPPAPDPSITQHAVNDSVCGLTRSPEEADSHETGATRTTVARRDRVCLHEADSDAVVKVNAQGFTATAPCVPLPPSRCVSAALTPVSSSGSLAEGVVALEGSAAMATAATAPRPALAQSSLPVVEKGRAESPAATNTTASSTCASETLSEMLRPQMPPLSIGEVQRFTREVLQGLCFMHAHNYAHLDIKTANVLITANEACRVADLGCAMRLCLPLPTQADTNDEAAAATAVQAHNEEAAAATTSTTALPPATRPNYPVLKDYNTITELRGTALYMAPEMIRFERALIGSPADIWSLGCVVMEMSTGSAPWRHLSRDKLRVLFRVGSAREDLPLPPLIQTWAAEAAERLAQLDMEPTAMTTAASTPPPPPFVSETPTSVIGSVCAGRKVNREHADASDEEESCPVPSSPGAEAWLPVRGGRRLEGVAQSPVEATNSAAMRALPPGEGVGCDVRGTAASSSTTTLPGVIPITPGGFLAEYVADPHRRLPSTVLSAQSTIAQTPVDDAHPCPLSAVSTAAHALERGPQPSSRSASHSHTLRPESSTAIAEDAPLFCADRSRAETPAATSATELYEAQQRHVLRLYVELENFVACCLHVAPEDRWSAEELLHHPFLTM